MAKKENDRALQRSTAVNMIIEILTSFEDEDRRVIMTAVAALMDTAPTHSSNIGIDPGQVMGGFTAR